MALSTSVQSRAGMSPSSGGHHAPAARAASVEGQERRENAYRHLDPVLAAYATTEPGDRNRDRMRDQLLAGFLPLARNIARRYANRGEPREDLEQVGALGLLKAIDRYDPALGGQFLAFAVPTITGEIRRHFRDRTWAMRVPRALKELHGAIPGAITELSAQLQRAPRPSEIAAHLNVATADVVEALNAAQAYRPQSLDAGPHSQPDTFSYADTLGTTDSRFELFTASHSLAPHLAALPPRERRILIMRFYEDMTQTQIAEKIGVSQMHVSRILAATLAKLRDAVDNPAAGDRAVAS